MPQYDAKKQRDERKEFIDQRYENVKRLVYFQWRAIKEIYWSKLIDLDPSLNIQTKTKMRDRKNLDKEYGRETLNNTYT